MNNNPNAPRIHAPYKSSSGNRGLLFGLLTAIAIIVALAIMVGVSVWRGGDKKNASESVNMKPDSVVTTFLSSIQSKNWNALNNLIYVEPQSSDPDKSNPDYIVQHDIRSLFDSTNITNFDVKKVQIHSETATVWFTLTTAPVNAPVSVKPMQINPAFELKLVNGEWKISKYILPVNQ